uniref:Uncharacterized protein n=1 Tax=Siphoviridae sp. cthHz3 TaxID=2825614 RepID=A0A8S5UYQ4_9CAUD|nr:MAG TPA: hypothetical protein [Siphoviridae sp. cthHz3]
MSNAREMLESDCSPTYKVNTHKKASPKVV